MPLRTSYLALAVSVMLSGCTDSVAAPTAPAPGDPELAKSSNVTTVTRSDVKFTIPGGTCGPTTTITGTGVFQSVSRVSETGNGGLRVAFSESAHGTATGEDGSRYRFNYEANYQVIDVLDPSGLPVVIDLVDHFNLLGQDGAPDVKVFLKGQFLFDGSLPLTPIGDPTIRGDLACDPI